MLNEKNWFYIKNDYYFTERKVESENLFPLGVNKRHWFRILPTKNKTC